MKHSNQVRELILSDQGIALPMFTRQAAMC